MVRGRTEIEEERVVSEGTAEIAKRDESKSGGGGDGERSTLQCLCDVCVVDCVEAHRRRGRERVGL